MSSRIQIQTACQRCRKKRAKCNGKSPCQRCEEAGEACQYDRTRRESKGELRAETERLKHRSADTDKLLRALASIQDPYVCKTVLQELVDGNKSREDILKGFTGEFDTHANLLRDAFPQQAYYAESAITKPKAAVGLPCFGQLLSWKSCRPSLSDGSEAPSIPSTILSLPPLPLDDYTSSQSQMDTWTRTGWTKAHIRHLVDALSTWDYLPFCLICKDLFMQDYHSGSSRFCSSALVHAILALATRLVNEDNDDAGLRPSGWFESKQFFDEAEAIVRGASGPFNSLPDIQALGILSLYLIRRGRETEALEFAEVFAASITDLCQRAPLRDDEDEQYARARATTHCGAVSLIRILSLATGQLFNVSNHTARGDLLFLDQLSLSSEGTSQWSGSPKPDLSIGALNAQLLRLISAKIFQLTEWVHKMITSAQADAKVASTDVETMYNRCLDWYTELFALLNSEGSRTPFALFVHMYYHFCLLCAFRPFVGLAVENPDIQPHAICTQAAHSILALAQSYDDLFTLRRVSGLIPYFVCASGLLNLAMEDSHTRIDSVHLRIGDDAPLMAKPEPKAQGSAGEQSGASITPSHVKISAAAHARLLLAKIGTTHPAATMAHRLLREEMGGEDDR